jgi:hypothetical protein
VKKVAKWLKEGLTEWEQGRSLTHIQWCFRSWNNKTNEICAEWYESTACSNWIIKIGVVCGHYPEYTMYMLSSNRLNRLQGIVTLKTAIEILWMLNNVCFRIVVQNSSWAPYRLLLTRVVYMQLLSIAIYLYTFIERSKIEFAAIHFQIHSPGKALHRFAFQKVAILIINDSKVPNIKIM